MTRRQKEPLRQLEEKELEYMEELSRARSAPIDQVFRAKILLGVSRGMGYEEAARSVGRKSGDAVSQLVSRLIKEGWQPWNHVMMGVQLSSMEKPSAVVS